MTVSDERLVEEFHKAATFLLTQMREQGWKHFGRNFLREYVRCKVGLEFTNTRSPAILEALVKKYPQWDCYVFPDAADR